MSGETRLADAQAIGLVGHGEQGPAEANRETGVKRLAGAGQIGDSLEDIANGRLQGRGAFRHDALRADRSCEDHRPLTCSLIQFCIVVLSLASSASMACFVASS